jgi:hypothetical protein
MINFQPLIDGYVEHGWNLLWDFVANAGGATFHYGSCELHRILSSKVLIRSGMGFRQYLSRTFQSVGSIICCLVTGILPALDYPHARIFNGG